ncbi:Chitinase [Colletotrichum higginsianum IMI 349063]|uniref:chitinase n=1 Tax=Colletotrichum higginsianum (strain IMI 349063) TaxID=759273 RepID=A0A1B7XRF7_COLHI|nr:Chitinase [Colletotrichum higginsianum IMI 349063]OBR02336.1 Chitinase [Colletotrichum higginsianum IMI 349063]
MWRPSLSAGIGLLCLASSAFARNEASPVNPCPVRCTISGPNPLNWTYLHGAKALKRCDQPMLFDTMLETRVNDPDKHITFRACTASEESTVKTDDFVPVPFTFGAPEKRSLSDNIKSTCASDMHKTPNQTSIFYHEWLPDDSSPVDGSINDTALAIETLQGHLDAADNCGTAIMFAKVRESIAGLFVGSAVDKKSAAPFVEKLARKVKTKEFYEAGRFAATNCQTVRPSVWRVGVVADLQGNMTSVQEALSDWKDAKCLRSPDLTAEWTGVEVELWSIKSSLPTNGTDNLSNSTAVSGSGALHTLHRRADCRAEEVISGDDCGALAKRCGISATQFDKYNSGTKNLCSTLKPRQHVCCSPGDLPDFRPKPDANGNCHAIDIDKGFGCWDYADANYLTVKDIEDFNKNTWGFAGCKNLQPGQKICLSKGEPPMPNPISNALCGPQKPDGEPRGSKNLTDMNPCPLNVCCNVWGQCGMDSDFCTLAPADTGAPGTSQPGKNGCISNCGMEITNNDKGPASFSHIAYFEAWNKNRPCLHMDVTSVDTKKYTHIHFSFPDVTPGDFKIDTSKLQTQFDLMKKMTGIKRIVSLGGWAFSAEGDTVHILRDAVLPANRATFAANVVQFVNDNGLDGIDFDWEYPSAPDIPDIDPSANPNEGKDYLEFLKMVKRRLGNKSVSIAAPASYWYLKQFPIKEIGEVVDYIVYMSYDLHGQWDHGNKWSSPGCPGGDCLRSHINMTETKTSLAMITKAGVPSHKVFVGIASYGRSFHMSEEGCTGPECTFTGTRSQSDAMPGPCTDTSGYISSAEIREILWNKDLLDASEWHDKDSDSDIVVYKGTEWVAWMNDDTKKGRIDKYKGLNFGGVSDWAVDLDKDYGDSGIGSGDSDDSNLSGGRNCPLSKTYTDLEALANDGDVSDDCKPVLAINILERMLDKSLSNYDDVDNGYDKNFAAYRRVMKDSAKQAMAKFTSWHDGKYRDYFDCDIKADGVTHSGDWTGPCSDMKGHFAVTGMNIIKLTLRDEDGFWDAVEKETGVIQEWVEFGTFKYNTDPNEVIKNCPPPVGMTPQPCVPSLILSISGYPQLKSDFDIPDPKDIIKDVKKNLDEIRTSISARFFDVVAGIWDGGNGDVLQVLSVPIFLLAQAITSMEEAKKKGGEIIKEEKEALILNIISALLFFIPFVGEFAAMAAGAATVARMIALGGLVGNTAFSIAEIAGDPSNAGMAIMALLSAGRIKKPRDFIDLGSARRAQTKAGVSKMGTTFRKHDDSLQKVVGNCRKEGDKDDDKEPNACKFKRDLGHSYLETRDVVLESHQAWVGKRAANNNNKNNCPTTEHETTTTKIETVLTTPGVTCKKEWSQACYHYSSVMSVHSNTPDMVRWTCWATSETGRDGLATDRWGFWPRQTRQGFNMPRLAQHHWDWGQEWTEHDSCDRDEFPPRHFWGAINTGKKNKAGEIRFKATEGQMVRLIPAAENRGAGGMWKQFCEKNDGYENKLPGLEKINEKHVTTDKNSKVGSSVKGGTTTYTTSLKVTIPNAVFEINHWEQTPAKDDGLWDNPCWPSMLRPNDPGYALLTNDAWYAKNPGAQQFTAAYHNAPPAALTRGLTKVRAMDGRPIIAPRELGGSADDEGTEMCAAQGRPQDECDAEPGQHQHRRRQVFVDEDGNEEGKVFVDEDGNEREVFVDEDGDEYVDLLPSDGLDFSALGQLPTPSMPRTAEAFATAVADVEEEMEAATPGSAIAAGLPEPTKGMF